ncbi:hypothetical protein DRN67_01705 [Candidatus Micrarchaeota archaeon]|nr:MAG: hypothetical protein DRN67_01705 [Candidatus Micrarchaeota archaeon]
MYERWVRGGAAIKEVEVEDRDTYGVCPVCYRELRTIGGFGCDRCGRGVCRDCIRKYKDEYLCLQCTTQLSEEEQKKVESADELVNPLPYAFRRTFLWWAVLVLLVAPIMLSAAWFFYTAGSMLEASIVIIVLILLTWYWNNETARWI